MKTTTLLFLSFFMLISIKAQTITVDGNMSDWAEVPVLSEPGVFPYAKVHVTEDNVYYMIEIEETAGDFTDNPSYDALRAYIDADRSATTGRVSSWLHISAGQDYDLTSAISPWDGSTMYWGSATIQRVYSATVAEAGFNKSQLAISVPAVTAIPLAESFGMSVSYKIGGGGETHLPANDYNFPYRNAYSVKPRTIAAENVGIIELTSANAFYMPFMRDENIDDYLDFQSGTSPTQDPDQWASWAIDLTTPAIYDIKMTYSCDAGGGAKMDFYLVDMATNETVYSQEDIDYEAAAGEFTEKQLGSQLDLSAVPAGKYMLKIKKQIKWAANNLKVQKLTLENTSPPTYNPIVKNNVSIWNESTTLFLKSATACNLNVYSLTGVEVFSAENALSLKTELPQGVFIVKTSIAGKTLAQKVVIK